MLWCVAARDALRNQDIPTACIASWMYARLSMHPVVLGPPEERGMAGDVL